MGETSPLLSSAGNNDHEENREAFPSALRGRKVLLATESWGPVNGVSRTTRSLVEYLRDNGVELVLVAPHFKGDKQQKKQQKQQKQQQQQQQQQSQASQGEQQQQQQEEYRLPGAALPYNPDLTVVYPFHLRHLFRHTVDPDLIYLASPASLGFQILLQVRQLWASPPVLLNFQTDLSAYAEILLPGPLARFGVWLLATVQGFLFRSAAVRTIFYPCSAIQRYLEAAGAPVDRLVQLGRGVDTAMFTPAQRDEAYRHELAPNGEIILICVCRIAPEKGFEFLSEVAHRLVAAKMPFKLLIVGGNRNPTVENRVRRLFDGVREHVVFTGFLTGVPLARAYASADLFLHCSVTETFGLVVLEAMASGLPVIARDQGGPSDIIRHDQTGYLVPPSDLEGYTALVEEITRDTARRGTLAAAARQYGDDTTWEKINRRAAWHMADALHSADQESRAAKTSPGIAASLLEQLLLLTAVGIVYFMWLIAVVPLIVHGHRCIPRTWQALRQRLRCAPVARGS